MGISNALTITLASVALVAALPQGYQAPGSGSFGGSSFVGGGSSGGFISGGGSGGGFISGGGHSGGDGVGISFGDGCGAGQIRDAHGQCITPEVTRNLYLYAAPRQQIETRAPKHIPNPKVHLNYVFVRTEGGVGGAQPVVVPPPKQKTLVYVLNKRLNAQEAEVIEVPANPTQPEVFFVNYEEGEDTQLPGGVSLQQALSQSLQQGQNIQALGGGSGGSGGISGGFIDGGIIGGGSIGGGVSSGGFVGGSSGGYQ